MKRRMMMLDTNAFDRSSLGCAWNNSQQGLGNAFGPIKVTKVVAT